MVAAAKAAGSAGHGRYVASTQPWRLPIMPDRMIRVSPAASPWANTLPQRPCESGVCYRENAPGAFNPVRHGAAVQACGAETAGAPVDRNHGRRPIVVAPTTALAAAHPAATIATAWKPAAANRTPSTAVASRPAMRAIALLIPEATPAWLGSTEASTTVVRGATASVMPAPISRTPGRTDLA